MSKDQNSALAEILKRLERLEKEVFNNAVNAKTESKAPNAMFKGPSGGIRLLIKEGYFDTQRNRLTVHAALGKKGYHYQADVVQMALNRLSSSSGPLVSMKSKEGKVYVKRK